MSDVKELFNQMNEAFSDFKESNNAQVQELIERQDKLELDLQQQGLGSNMGYRENQQDKQYKDAFRNYLNLGERALNTDLKNTLSSGNGPDGAYWIDSNFRQALAKKIYELSPMRQLASVEVIDTDRLYVGIDTDEASSGWVSELQERSSTSTPEVGEQEIQLHELYCMPEITQRAADVRIKYGTGDLSDWLINKIAQKIAREEATAFFTGDGIKKPRGFLDYPTEATGDDSRAWGTIEHVLTGSSASIPDTPDELIDLTFKLKADYHPNAVWLMNRSTMASIRKMAGGSGSEIYWFMPENMSDGRGGLQILGYPVVLCPDMPSAGSGNIVAAFGDFSAAYQIVDHKRGVAILRDNLTRKGFIRYYTTKYIGADLVSSEALKLLVCTS